MENILSVFKNNRDGKRMREIKSLVINNLSSSGNELVLFDEDKIKLFEKQVEQLVKEDAKNGSESLLKYANGKYTKRPNRRPPQDADKPASIYIGTAGETAVMSELMFNGYNVNRMMIDEGVDIVAAKNNIYFYIQVKTTYIENGRIHCQINDVRYDQYIQTQMRYIIVARYNQNGVDRNMFFVFNNTDIERNIYNKCIKRGQNCISIKIKFDSLTAKPILYDEKETDIAYHLNNFKLT